jgi:hypothetical protein
MISRCCGTEVSVVNSEDSYYVCEMCFKACDLKEIKDESSPMGNHREIKQRYDRKNESTRWLDCLSNKRVEISSESCQLVCA